MYFHLYRGAANQWRWRLVAGNGKIVADSAEGYVNKQDCLNGIALVQGSAKAPIKE
jgi:uncharacterized protein YegP (UPF0339 family)